MTQTTKDQQDELKLNLLVIGLGLSDLAAITVFFFNDFHLKVIGITIWFIWFISIIIFILTLKKQEKKEVTLP